MSWFVHALLYVLLTSVSNVFRKILLRDDKNDLYASAIIFQFLGGIISGVFAVIHGFVFPPLSSYPLNFLLTTVLWALATICIFKAYREIETSEVTIITSLQSIVIICAGIFFLHEFFTISNAIGAFLISISAIVISYGKGKLVFNKG